MLEAQRLLSYSSLSVKEIADALGFEDESYFNRLFSKVVGVSPGAFRKKQTIAAAKTSFNLKIRRSV
jgi:AraC family transcriptional activator of pobA